ncbi:hypothetical protein ACFQWB_06955 [Paenibacillus thermoaerophilus]|uniref:Uncharacterized protein n=1 Tax=Paenibacillus thermoaerophilus TaxID=1215385 RepID=A0ABW2V0J8_9BACL|nr:hypothetical protein [Paenibacillus thermoaerophilus]TMV11007.1 hypothetical protein FE781_13190 [Paenibacillus thermoaerophilus]
MDFLNKLRVGASIAAEKAQQTMEVAKLTTAIYGKKRDLERNTSRIGEAVYEAYKAKDLSLAEREIFRLAKLNEGLENDIAELERQAVLLKRKIGMR